MPKALSPIEEDYVDKALVIGKQSTEILYVLAFYRMQSQILNKLIGAMTVENYKVEKMKPLDIQTMFTELMVGIRQVHNEGISALDGVSYIPRSVRMRGEKKTDVDNPEG